MKITHFSSNYSSMLLVGFPVSDNYNPNYYSIFHNEFKKLKPAQGMAGKPTSGAPARIAIDL